ncbi:hypothetical protein NB311A_02139 [Nitrobacter sp. Nb-311A]|nr:hypothetical protein NB311A_02139 [Nitrobacter sp. Nb-311A]
MAVISAYSAPRIPLPASRLPSKQSFATRTLSSKSTLWQMIRPAFSLMKSPPPAAAGGGSRLNHPGSSRERNARERHRFWVKQALELFKL